MLQGSPPLPERGHVGMVQAECRAPGMTKKKLFLSYLLVLGGKRMAPSAPPGSLMPSRGWSRNPAPCSGCTPAVEQKKHLLICNFWGNQCVGGNVYIFNKHFSVVRCMLYVPITRNWHLKNHSFWCKKSLAENNQEEWSKPIPRPTVEVVPSVLNLFSGRVFSSELELNVHLFAIKSIFKFEIRF